MVVINLTIMCGCNDSCKLLVMAVMTGLELQWLMSFCKYWW